MIDENDLKLIGEEMGRVIEDNLLPQLEVMIEDKLAENLNPIRGAMASMVTKDYLDQKLGTVNGKITVLADALLKNGAITSGQRAAVREA